jgi:hypothetical protein
MALGSKGKCMATLVGEENKGLSMMFLMMNKARLMVGSQGLACASSAYLHALAYARTRIQGSLPTDPDKKPVAIIRHPDIRRMLLTMKMYTEGMRSLLCYIANLEDKKCLDDKAADKDKCQNLIDILIPVAKGYVTDRAVDVCNMAVQVFGGYGYVSEFPVEQLLRDVRVTTIYEGTNGIQAIDLLTRKLTGKNNTLFRDLVNEIEKTIDTALKFNSLENLAQSVAAALGKLKQAAKELCPLILENSSQTPYVFASSFLEVTGDIIMAWMLLWRAEIAQNRLEKNIQKKEIDFYAGQLKSAQFFISSVLPVTMGKIESILNFCGSAIEISDTSFGGK